MFRMTMNKEQKEEEENGMGDPCNSMGEMLKSLSDGFLFATQGVEAMGPPIKEVEGSSAEHTSTQSATKEDLDSPSLMLNEEDFADVLSAALNDVGGEEYDMFSHHVIPIAQSEPTDTIATALKAIHDDNDNEKDVKEEMKTEQKVENSTTVAATSESELEGIELFEQECEILAAMYEEVTLNAKKNSVKIQLLSQSTFDTAQRVRQRVTKGLYINMLRLKGYPMRSPEITIEPWHNLLSRDEVDNLYRSSNSIAQDLAQCNREGDCLQPILASICGCIVDLVDGWVRVPATRIIFEAGTSGSTTQKHLGGSDATTTTMLSMGLHSRDPLAKLSPTAYLGSMGDVLGRIPKNYDVINVENILREDLALRFEKMQRYYFSKYVKPHLKTRNLRLDPRILGMADIVPAFHGTRMQTIGKIVRNGMIVPGKDTGVKVSTGSRYGKGIYVSPNPEFALHYAESGRMNDHSIKILVVATLKGKALTILDGEEMWGGGVTEGYDTHVSENGEQICVFHEWQVLPCYVVHLMERKEREYSIVDENYAPITSKLDAQQMPVGKTDRKQLLTQLAKKNLPFGFGPAGDKFVVEEIAPYSDDEEDWGEYQLDRDTYCYEEYQHETLLASNSQQASEQNWQQKQQKQFKQQLKVTQNQRILPSNPNQMKW